MNELFFAVSTFAAIVGSLAAIFSALCASLAYRLSQKIHNDLKADEKIIFGQPQEPHLANKDHSSCVIVCTLLNKSRRKAFVKSVRAIDEQGEEVPHHVVIKDRWTRKPTRPVRFDGTDRFSQPVCPP